MYKLQFRGVDLLVTPNHNLYVSKGSYYNGKKNNFKKEYPFSFKKPEEVFKKTKRFKKGCKWIGNKPNEQFVIPGKEYNNYMKINNCNRHYKLKDFSCNIDSFLKFLGFYIAEGCVSCGTGNGTSIQIAYNPKKEEKLVCDLINNIGGTPKNSTYGAKRFHNATLAYWLKENCGHLAWNKKVPDFIKELEPKYIEEFLEYLFIGDGYKSKTSNILYTTSKRLSDDVQELLLKCGYSFREMIQFLDKYNKEISEGKRKIKPLNNGKTIKRKRDCYKINWLKKCNAEVSRNTIQNSKKYKEEWVNYKGNVYCVTVPNGILYVKRYGKGVWCGNSLRWYDNGISSQISKEYNKWLDKYEELSKKTCIVCGEEGHIDYSESWLYPACDKCRKEM